VLVTGGAHRLGGAIAEALARDGARVAIHFGTSRDQAEALAARIVAEGGRQPALLQADLRDAAAARALGASAAEALGGLDAVVNSAGTFERVAWAEVTPDLWDRVLAVNVRAYFFVVQGAGPALRESNGTVVNISDIAAFDVWPDYIPHGVSKAGVEMLTRSLALALAPEITVNAIAPGAVLVPDDWDEAARARRAERSPLRRLGSPDDVIGAVRYLLHARYVTGTTLVVDGGQLIRRRDELEG
jgi:pteridine reductase